VQKLDIVTPKSMTPELAVPSGAILTKIGRLSRETTIYKAEKKSTTRY
jgi:hypothetical protein